MNATPENFRPGERWIVRAEGVFIEVVCLEWSPSVDLVSIFYPHATQNQNQWRRPYALGVLYERLPDESGNHKTGQAGGIEATCGQCACCRWEIEQHRNSLTPQEVEKLAEESDIWQRHEYTAKKIKAHAESINNETC